MPIIRTARLDLISAGVAELEAELRGTADLERALGMPLARDWPPEHWDAPVLRWVLGKLATGGAGGAEGVWWSPRYVVLREGGPQLVGTCGCKGPPDGNGCVEIGYGVAASFQRRGIASEAARGLIDWAWRDERVKVIIAHTLADGAGSQGVLRRCGFAFVGPGYDPDVQNVLKFELRRPSGV